MNDDAKKEIEQLEAAMAAPDFWANKEKAHVTIKKIQELKARAEGGGPYDTGSAVVTIFSGAGGDDAEDFSRILFEMYQKYADKKGWPLSVVHENANDHNGYRNITFQIEGKNAYGTLKHESGVHRLVRISPFDANKRRHTSFSMVEVIPKFDKTVDVEIPNSEITIEFAKSSGPGGQNVNKRESAVRIVHAPTGIVVHCSAERSQAANREKALMILRGKLYKHREEERMAKEKGMYVSKTTSAEWGNQIRSYVLHPYQMVKDHRTGRETGNVDAVLAGNLDEFIEAEHDLLR